MEVRSRIAAGLAGVQVSILGAILAAGSSEVSRQSGQAVAEGTLLWAFGLALGALGLFWPQDGPPE